MLYRRYSNNSKEGFENVKTRIVTEEEWRRLYPNDMKLSNATNDFFNKYGAAPYSDEYNSDNLLEGVDLDTIYAFVNRFGLVYMYNNKVLPRNPNMTKFLKKIGWTTRQVSPPFLGSDNKIHILDDDEVAKKIFSQFTYNASSSSNDAKIGPSQKHDMLEMPNNSGAGQDNYNHFNGSSVPTMFYGPNGSTAKISNENGTFSIIVTDNNGTNVVYDEENKSALAPSSLAAIDIVIDKIIKAIGKIQQPSSNPSTPTSTNTDSVQKYYGQDGSVAIIYTDNTGNSNLKIIDKNGKEYAYNPTSIQSFNPSIDNPDNALTTGNTISPNATNQASNYTDAYSQSLTKDNYSSSLPKGIPKYMIPPGNEDLYILKSEVVPPVCPACPPSILKCGDNKPPPPCPPCARCPEPKFDCKKVPNYGNGNIGANYYGGGGQFGSMPSKSGNFLPYPSLTDYTTFGN
jgi:hypothetical protein